MIQNLQELFRICFDEIEKIKQRQEEERLEYERQKEYEQEFAHMKAEQRATNKKRAIIKAVACLALAGVFFIP